MALRRRSRLPLDRLSALRLTLPVSPERSGQPALGLRPSESAFSRTVNRSGVRGSALIVPLTSRAEDRAAAALKDHQRHPVQVHRTYGREIGLVSRRGTNRFRYA